MQFSLRSLMILTLAVCLFCVFGVPVLMFMQFIAVFLVMVMLHGTPDQKTFAIGMIASFVSQYSLSQRRSNSLSIFEYIPFFPELAEYGYTLVSMVLCGYFAVWAKRRITDSNSPPIKPPPYDTDSK